MRLDQAPDVLTVPEVAACLRVNRKTAYEAVASGELPAVRIGRAVRVTRYALLRYLGLDPGDDGGGPSPAASVTQLAPSRQAGDSR